MNLIRLQDVIDKTRLSKSTIYRLHKAGRFPKKLAMSARTARWVESEIDDWIKTKRIESSGGHDA